MNPGGLNVSRWVISAQPTGAINVWCAQPTNTIMAFCPKSVENDGNATFNFENNRGMRVCSDARLDRRLGVDEEF